MKTILICENCQSQHSISTSKIAGKKGKFRCQNCHSYNEFNFRILNQKQITSKAILFDLHFKEEIPSHQLQGQIGADYEKEITAIWETNRLSLIWQGDQPENRGKIEIKGISDPKRLKGFVYDSFVDSLPTQLQIVTSNDETFTTGFRLSLFVEELTDKHILGRMYLAIPGKDQICIHGDFSAKRVYLIYFDENGSFEEPVPSFLSNLLNAKIFALAGNTLYLQESFSLLFEEDKSQILNMILSHWPLDSNSASEVHFVQEYIHCIFKITERKLNETFVFLMVNHVMPSKLDWAKIKELVHISEKEPAFVPILKKKFPKQYEDQVESLKKEIIGSSNLDWLEKGDPSFVDVFLSTGNSVNYVEPNPSKNPLKFSLLHEAIDRSKTQITLRLLERGADVNQRDLNGETALFKLSQNNSFLLKDKSLLMDEILRHKVNVNVQSINGMTALHWCSIFGEPTLAKKLLLAGINLHISDLNGNTPLHEACKFGHSSVLALLLESGARPNEKNNEEKTGRDLAFEGLEIAELEGDLENKNRFQRILSLLDVYGG
ncbi:MAG: ankyrin repeat domain-containing protein [Leptospira sp.]|nr:ankyrin repeat domain-containing protein [Leptospira sp.]